MHHHHNYFLFVYGSLRKGFHSDVYYYISSYFNFVCSAKTQGILSDMGEYPAATPSAKQQAFIYGELYHIINEHEFSWAIGQLDDYEGLHAEEGETALFKRELADVMTEDGNTIKAWVYWYNGDITDKPVIESGDVLEYFRKKNGGNYY